MGRLVGLDLSKVKVDGEQVAVAPEELTITKAPVEEVVEEAEKPKKKAKKNDK